MRPISPRPISLILLDCAASIEHRSVMERAQGIPVLVDVDGGRRSLERIYLGAGTHKESWLQALIQEQPHILPIAQIEPGFGELIPAAREVACGHGLIDNLFVTPSGDLVLVETKLWRNNEIRREVVAQALDYVAAITAMAFADFELVVSKAQGGPARLYDLVADHPDALDEPAFADAVANNLRRGRMLVIALGDGIRSETEALADLLQSHAGAHFTFALVEVATWRDADGGILAIPSTLARTVMIERGVVRLEGSGIRVEPAPVDTRGRAQSLSMSDFMALVAERDPALPRAINAFIDAVEPLGVYPDLKATLSFKIDLPTFSSPINLGYIAKNGKFWTDAAAWKMPESVWRPYFEALAGLIGGSVKTEPSTYVIGRDGAAPAIGELLPQHLDALVGAITQAIRMLNEQ